uniref:IS256 family transposase n=1 Tax=Candidatus Vondammii sp. HM_W22 TaxID=2687299 RepID=UPI002E7B1EAA|nr:IS256 family transposase [Candidatus Vondammii sp. HM_W22]
MLCNCLSLNPNKGEDRQLINKKELQAIAQATANHIKTEEDLNEFRPMLAKITVEAALNVELDDHLDFAKHEQSEASNSRNGTTSKTLQTEDGQFEQDIPRERVGSFKPRLVKKHQRRFTSMHDKILFLMTTREIVTIFKEMYGADVSATLISKVTDAVIEQVDEWQSRPLDAIQPIVYLDSIVIKIRQYKKVINKAIYPALGVNLEGHKELSRMWLSENQGAKFWLNLLPELQNRGVKDILIVRVDGLKGFPDAINTALYCAYATELDEVAALERLQACAADLKKSYQSITGEEALPALDKFSDRWDNKHPG